MGVEIERKFLVVDDSWREAAPAGVRYRQGYLSTDPRSAVRVRVSGDRAWLNIKSATVGVTRREYEYEIPAPDAHAILEELCVKPLIEKTRFVVEHAGMACGDLEAECGLAQAGIGFNRQPRLVLGPVERVIESRRDLEYAEIVARQNKETPAWHMEP